MSITADNQILTRAVGVDDALAVVMIGELRQVIARLESQLPDEYEASAALRNAQVKARVSKLHLV